MRKRIYVLGADPAIYSRDRPDSALEAIVARHRSAMYHHSQQSDPLAHSAKGRSITVWKGFPTPTVVFEDHWYRVGSHTRQHYW